MIVKYNKKQIIETNTGKEIKMQFDGSFEGLKVSLSLSGDKDSTQMFLENRNLTHYGQELDIEIENKQLRLGEQQ